MQMQHVYVRICTMIEGMDVGVQIGYLNWQYQMIPGILQLQSVGMLPSFIFCLITFLFFIIEHVILVLKAVATGSYIQYSLKGVPI